MNENEISGAVLDAAVKLHKQFGPGMLESVYEALLTIELTKRGHKVERQKSISFEYEGVKVENAFRLDMLIDGQVIVELKSTEQNLPVYLKQIKTYLAITGLHLGLLVNFGKPVMKDGFARVVNGYMQTQNSHTTPLTP